MDNTIKIQKYIALCGIMSRRSAEDAVASGNVTVNGIVAEKGQRIDPRRDRVEFMGRAVKFLRGEHKSYIMLNKPRGYVTTMKDEKGRKSVNMLVSPAGKRVYPVGRLDMDSEGLLLMTDDGDFANDMMHPSRHVAKKYEVTVSGSVGRKEIEALSSVNEIDGVPVTPALCELTAKDTDKSIITITLFEGKNRQIRKMCEKCSLDVKKLKRVSIGCLSLDVPVGKWRYLTKKEVDLLKAQISDGRAAGECPSAIPGFRTADSAHGPGENTGARRHAGLTAPSQAKGKNNRVKNSESGAEKGKSPFHGVGKRTTDNKNGLRARGATGKSFPLTKKKED